MNKVFKRFFVTFPPFFAEKRFKLCNFAPKNEMVDKCVIVLILKE